MPPGSACARRLRARGAEPREGQERGPERGPQHRRANSGVPAAPPPPGKAPVPPSPAPVGVDVWQDGNRGLDGITPASLGVRGGPLPGTRVAQPLPKLAMCWADSCWICQTAPKRAPVQGQPSVCFWGFPGSEQGSVRPNSGSFFCTVLPLLLPFLTGRPGCEMWEPCTRLLWCWQLSSALC